MGAQERWNDVGFPQCLTAAWASDYMLSKLGLVVYALGNLKETETRLSLGGRFGSHPRQVGSDTGRAEKGQAWRRTVIAQQESAWMASTRPSLLLLDHLSRVPTPKHHGLSHFLD